MYRRLVTRCARRESWTRCALSLLWVDCKRWKNWFFVLFSWIESLLCIEPYNLVLINSEVSVGRRALLIIPGPEWNLTASSSGSGIISSPRVTAFSQTQGRGRVGTDGPSEVFFCLSRVCKERRGPERQCCQPHSSLRRSRVSSDGQSPVTFGEAFNCFHQF